MVATDEVERLATVAGWSEEMDELHERIRACANRKADMDIEAPKPQDVK